MGPALGTPDQWIGVGLSASPWDLAVVYRLGQAEIGFDPAGITQTYQVWLGPHFSS